MNLDRVRDLFANFDFATLFIEELHWSQPKGLPSRGVTIDEITWTAKPIAQLAGVVVLEVSASTGDIPDAKTRSAIHKEIAKAHYENLLIFVDRDRNRSEWFWVKRENGKESHRPHRFERGDAGDLFLGKVGPLFFDEHDFANGDPSVIEVAHRLRLGLDVEKVTKNFYKEFEEQHRQFIELTSGIADDHQRRWYASVILNRLMFIWFLQRKGFVDGNLRYLETKLDESRARGQNLYFREFLTLLFFEGFAKPEGLRSEPAKERLGNICYLNGGLFLPHATEQANPDIDVPDVAFENLFALFRRYTWNLDDTPGTDSREINPDVLGYIFEKYINQKAFGAYYTRPEITDYLCERTIERLILDSVNTSRDPLLPPLPGKKYAFDSLAQLLHNLDANLCRFLFTAVLPRLSILDPACGSGAFLVAAMKTLIKVYSAVIGRIRFVGDSSLQREIAMIEVNDPNIDYYVKRSIIANNLFGVDIMEEAVEIARLRLFLALIASAREIKHLKPLPNIDFNLLAGNSLIGLMRVDENKFQTGNLFRKSYRQVVDAKNLAVSNYRSTAARNQDELRSLRDNIDDLRSEAAEALDKILLEQFGELGIKYEEATWDHSKQREGKGKKRFLTLADIRALHPFHWGYEFDDIVNTRRGFDAILTNPPWEAVEPKAKEFFEKSKNSTDIKDFEDELQLVLQNPDTMKSWLGYLSEYNHQREYFRKAPEYQNQIPIINGKRQGKDVNLYKLFLERCTKLLRDGGECGIVIPGGIYSDLGAKRLREMLFESTEITGLFGFENRKLVFEGIDSRFKFVILTYRKGGQTERFPATFMRHHVEELSRFPAEGSLPVEVSFLRRLSPDSLSLSEFRSAKDIEIAEKMLRHPLLGEEVPGSWKASLHREFNMTDDAYLFKRELRPGVIPLYEGKMIWQFDAFYAAPRYFIYEAEGRQALRAENPGDVLEYQRYRLAIRDVAANTNERTMIAAILPPGVFAGHTLHLCSTLTPSELLYLSAIFNSFVFDWLLRLKVSSHCSIFYIYQMPVPRLPSGDPLFLQLVVLAARLVCLGKNFESLALEAGITQEAVATDNAERSDIRAQIDAIVANLYNINSDEFNHILSAFPLVDSGTKERARTVFGHWKPPSDDPLLRLIAAGESARLEFKSTARWDLRLLQVNKAMEHEVVKTVAGFMNSDGGTLLIGVADSGEILGLAPDFKTLGKRANADGFENWLTGLLLEAIGRDRVRLLRVSFQTIEGKTVCRIDVDRSPRPVYAPDEKGAETFYIRAGNSTRELSISEAHAYVDEHFRARAIGAATEEQPSEPTQDSPVRQDEIPGSRVQPASYEPEAGGDIAPSKGSAQARLPMQTPTVERNADLSAHGLFREQEAAKRTPATASAEANAEDEDASPRRSIIEAYDTEDVLAIIRDVITTAGPMPREDAIKAIANQLGAERAGARIRDFIEGMLNTASRRLIIETRGGGFIASTRSIDDYHRDFLKTALKAVIGRTWTGEAAAIRAATRYLGFRRTGPKIERAFKSAINGLLRQNELERNGHDLRRPIQ